MMRRVLAVALVGLGLASVNAALASERGARAAARREESPCTGNATRVGDLGILALDCDCTYDAQSHSNDGPHRFVRHWMFRSEPRVESVRADGPSAGKLREGDAITAVDGVLITTRDGARRYAEVAPGALTTLTVRRDGREFPVRIVADGICPQDVSWPASLGLMTSQPPAPPAESQTPAVPAEPAMPDLTPTPESPQAPESPEAAAAPEVPPSKEAARRARRLTRLPRPAIPTEEALPRGWSGFGLTCQICGGHAEGDGEPPVWEFGTLPTIYYLDPGSPAAHAGLQTGDVLTHLDGVSLLTEEGGRRFGAQKPRQSVRWTFLRGGRVRSATVVTGPRPGETTIPIEELQERLRGLSDGQEAARLGAELAKAASELTRAGLLTEKRGAAGDRLRYAGGVGGSSIEVRGLGNVVVDDSGDEIVITTRDATIRIRPAAASAPKKREKR